MTPYADPEHCPDCGATLTGRGDCPSCGLPLDTDAARDLYATLQRADSIIDHLRAQRDSDAGAGAAADADAGVVAGADAAAPLPSYPSGSGRAPSTATPVHLTVPAVLLGLGGLCVIVAAVVFLAITWERLGIGARTGILLGFTAAAAALTIWLNGRRLRGGAETFGVLAAALGAFDLLGARSAGWFGTVDVDEFVAVAGALFVVAIAAAVLALRRHGPDLVGVQVVACVAFLASAAGWLGVYDQEYVAALAALLVVSVGAALLARRLRLWTLLGGPVLVAALSLLGLLSVGVDRTAAAQQAAQASASALWPLLVVAATVVVVARLLRLPSPVASFVWAGAVLLVIGGVAAPYVQSLDSLTMTALVSALGAAAATLVRRDLVLRSAGLVLLASAVVAALGPGTFLLTLLDRAAVLGARDGLRGVGSSELLTPTPSSVSGWVLVVVAAAGALVHLLLVLGNRADRGPAVGAFVRLGTSPADIALHWGPVLALGLVLAGADYGSSLLLTCLGLLAVVGLFGLAARALSAGATLALAGAAATWLLAAALALFGATTSLVVFGAGLAVTVGVLTGSRRADLRLIAALATPVLTLLTVAPAGRLLDLTDRVIALGVLVSVALVALALTDARVPGSSGWRRPVQAISLGVAALTVLAGTAAAPDPTQLLWLAVYLTVAGAGATLLGLLGRDRVTAGVGAALLLAATWVRLVDQGVTTPEAYSLPAAALLLGTGLWLLRTTPTRRTRDALGPGLALALGPSALVVLGEPISLRALLLGLACAALVAAGSLVRWQAPLLFGSLAGAVVVLVELVPLGQAVPRWSLIFTIGALLLVAGIRWEWMSSRGRKTWGLLSALR